MLQRVFVYFLYILLLKGCWQPGLAQLPSIYHPEQDCFGALPICQTTYSNSIAYTGSGAVANEINPTYSCLSTGEKNDVWYSFTTHSAGIIRFTISPFNIHDDYDWAVFNITHASCSTIYSDSSLEVSCNYDANVGCNGVTGANGNISSCGQTESPITVLNDETYLINISNYSSSQSGYTIDFSGSTAQILDQTPPLVAVEPVSCTQQVITMVFNERMDCNTFAGNATDFILRDPNGMNITPVSIQVNGCDSIHPYLYTARLTLPQPLASYAAYVLLANTGSDGNTVSDACGNFLPAGDTLAVILPQNNLGLSLGSDFLLCTNDPFPSLQVSLAGASYQWFLNDSILAGNVPAILTHDTGTYIVQASYGQHCYTADTLQISYLPSFLFSLGPDTIVCKNEDIPLLSVNLPNATTYSWFLNGWPANSNTPFFQPSSGGSIVLLVSGNNYCPSVDTVNLVVVDLPEISLPASRELCKGSSLTLNACTASPGSYQWFWNSEPLAGSDSVYIVNTEGKYTVLFTGNAGCSVSDSSLVSIKEPPVSPQIECPITSPTGQLFSWAPVKEATGYEISMDAGNLWTSVSEPWFMIPVGLDILTLQVRTNEEGCLSETAESPACHTAADVLQLPDRSYVKISGLETPSLLYIFDALGKLVFEDSAYPNVWHGSPLKPGIYFYTVRCSKAKYQSGKFLIKQD